MKRVLKTLFATIIGFSILVGATCGTDMFAVHAKATDTSIYLEYGAFGVSDIRDGKHESFAPGDGNVYVLVFGGMPDVGVVSNLAKMKPYLDERLKVIVLSVEDKYYYGDLKTDAEAVDENHTLIIGKMNDSLYQTFMYISSSVAGSLPYYNIPLTVFVNGDGYAYAYTTGYQDQLTIYENILKGGIEDTWDFSLNVEYHSQDEIIDFVRNHPINCSAPTYDVEPSITAPFSPGDLSYSSRQDALNAVNVIRYIAGLSYDITLDDTYNLQAQTGSLVNAVNGSMSHQPPHPEGMDQSLYETGYTGTSRSNLGFGYNSLAESIIYGYMEDGDPSNISMVGHRRWVLNPTMGKTGFGIVTDSYGIPYSAMYAFDTSGTSRGTVSVWPAINTPIEFFDGSYPWSFSLGTQLEPSEVRVEIKNTSTGRTWNFFTGTTDGFFEVNNESYGIPGCVIFRPYDITINDGDSYVVTISGLGCKKVSYTVNFFSLGDAFSFDRNSDDNYDFEDDFDDFDEEYQIDFSIFNVPAGCAMQARMYNPNSGEHFYTGSKMEVYYLVSAGWDFEGPGFITPTTGIPIYRLYSAEHGDHFYTTNEAEVELLLNDGWELEGENNGIAFPSADASQGVPMYRLHNPNAYNNNESGAHHFTTSWQEVEDLTAIGWEYEDIAWFSL